MSASLIFCDYCGAANEDAALCCFACGWTLSAESELSTAHLMKATRLLAGRYRVLSVLGQGEPILVRAQISGPEQTDLLLTNSAFSSQYLCTHWPGLQITVGTPVQQTHRAQSLYQFMGMDKKQSRQEISLSIASPGHPMRKGSLLAAQMPP